MKSERLPDSVVLGRNLRRLRKQAGLSMESLAANAGVTSSTVERIERGGTRRGPSPLPRGESVSAIAAALGCPTADLWAYPSPDDDEPVAATG